MQYDAVIIGAGAAGLMCAMEAGKRGRRVLVVEKSKKPAEKIRISGGGRCNFTNIHTSPANYLSQNPHFCKSALGRYQPSDFISLVEKHEIAYHEKTLGQLFCDGSSKQIIQMLLDECEAAGVDIRLETAVESLEEIDSVFNLALLGGEELVAESVVIATGGPSIPKMGASGWGYEIAKQFGLKLMEPRPALVPFTLEESQLTDLKPLSGISTFARAECNGTSFEEGMLFTHRGLSGPSILQISSYWREGDELVLDLLTGHDLFALLKELRGSNPKQEVQTALAKYLPKRLVHYVCEAKGYRGYLAEISNKKLQEMAQQFHQWRITPNGTEGYRTAEVTLGGVDTNELSSKTMESKKVKGLYFIGEVVDVTGHLGGYNFQWAWASGYAAGLVI